MVRSMSHPDYVYRPWSEARKRAARKRARAAAAANGAPGRPRGRKGKHKPAGALPYRRS